MSTIGWLDVSRRLRSPPPKVRLQCSAGRNSRRRHTMASARNGDERTNAALHHAMHCGEIPGPEQARHRPQTAYRTMTNHRHSDRTRVSGSFSAFDGRFKSPTVQRGAEAYRRRGGVHACHTRIHIGHRDCRNARTSKGLKPEACPHQRQHWAEFADLGSLGAWKAEPGAEARRDRLVVGIARIARTEASEDQAVVHTHTQPEPARQAQLIEWEGSRAIRAFDCLASCSVLRASNVVRKCPLIAEY
ncbi:hypothetical protein C8Q74DRAFT_503279 [Fomes fomentarius]|nr:hypothetical protein C8Q74DRAFT_503279 [Fomes fomentarius]